LKEYLEYLTTKEAMHGERKKLMISIRRQIKKETAEV